MYLPTRSASPSWAVDGVRMLAPAERFADKRNIVNPELYAVFPYRRIAIGRPGIELGIEALNRREVRGNFAWRKDYIFMAYLGLTEQAREYVVGRAGNGTKAHAFRPSEDQTSIGIPTRTTGGCC